MDKTTPPEDGSSLPEEIIFLEIFARLPAKSLHRFSCVSKPCRSIKCDRSFLESYRSLRRRYLLSFSASMHWQCVFYSVNEPPPTGKTPAKPFNYPTKPRYDSYAKSTNGLMCFATRKKVIVFNPETEEKHSLPRPPLLQGLDRQFVYFCFDPATDKYKVLRVVSSFDEPTQVESTKYMIFTIGTDKYYWREIDVQPELYQLRKAKSVCINGILFCTNFSTSHEVDDGVLAFFAVGEEFLGTISYPEGIPSSRYNSSYLVETKGRLNVIDIGDLESSIMKLWVNNSKGFYPDSESWVEYRIEFPRCWKSLRRYNCSLSSNSEGEIVVAVAGMSTPGCSILCYNIRRNEWRKIEVLGLRKHTILGSFLIEDYAENPLLLKNIFGTMPA